MEYITNSLEFSKKFNIGHNHVLERIKKTKNEKNWFKADVYINSRNREYPIFNISKEGYILLAITINCNGEKSKIIDIFKENLSKELSSKINTEDLEKCVPDNKVEREQQKTYILYDKHRGIYKIGRTLNIHTRMKAIKNVIPDITLIFVSWYDIEKELHEAFKEKRIDGEWFRLEEKDLKNIERIFKINFNGVGFYEVFNDIKNITNENSVACNQLKKFEKLMKLEDDEKEIQGFKKFIIKEFTTNF